MKVRLRFFAALREIAGSEEIQLEVDPGTSAGALWDKLTRDYPRLAFYSRSIQVAVNQDFAARERTLEPDDEVVFLPPVSGG